MFTHVSIPKLPVVIPRHTRGKHFYETPEGKIYPSVTTMLGYKEKPYLTDWRNSLGASRADEETKRCAERGTSVHDMAEKYLNNKKYPELTKKHLRLHVNLFNQLRTRLKQIDNIKATEVSLYSDTLKLAGTVDCVGEYTKIKSIIDFKTSNNNKTKEMIDDYFKQCAAYAIMWYEMTGELIENLVIIMAVERGIIPLIFQDNLQNWLIPLQEDIKYYFTSTKNN